MPPRRMLVGVLVSAALIACAVVLASREAHRDASPARVASASDRERGDPRWVAPAAHVREKAAHEEGGLPDAAEVRVEPRAAESHEPTLVVRLASSSGGPVAGASVEVERAGEEPPGGRPAAPGSFVFEGLRAGTWTVRASLPAHDDATREVYLPEHGGEVVLDVVLAARPAVRILVLTPEGEPFLPHLEPRMHAPRAVATRERPERFIDEVLEGGWPHGCGFLHDGGRLGFDERCLGLLELICEPPLWVHLALGLDVLESRLVESGVDELVFTLDPSEVKTFYPVVSLRVVDASTGEPLRAHATMAFGYWHSAGSFGQSPNHEPGSFSFYGLPGPASLELRSAGYEAVRMDLVLPRAPHHDLGTVAMTPTEMGELVLDVRTPDGIETAVVAWAPLDAFAERASLRPHWRLEVERGQTRLDVEVGRWVVWADAGTDGRKYAIRPGIHEISGGERHAVLALAPCVDVVLRAAEWHSIEIFDDEHGLPAAYPTVCGPEPLATQLVPGAYRVVGKGREGHECAVPLVVTAQGATVDLP